MNKKQHRITNIDELENSEWGRAAANPENLRNLSGRIDNLLSRIQGRPELKKRVRDAAQLFDRESKGGTMLTTRNVIVLGAALLYLLSPIDAIPDFLPVVGWLDDIGVIAMALAFLKPRGVDTEEEPETPLSPELPDYDLNTGDFRALQSNLEDMEREALAHGKAEIANQAAALSGHVADPLQRVVFGGGFNAGKSSLINALLGQELMPIGKLPTTPAPTTIVYGQEVTAVIEREDGSTIRLASAEQLEEYSLSHRQSVREMLLTCPSLFLLHNLAAVDTQGLFDEGDGTPYEMLPTAAAYVYLHPVNKGDLNRHETEHLTRVAAMLPEGRLMMVLSKTDTITEEKAAQIQHSIHAELCRLGHAEAPIVALSTRGEQRGLDTLRAHIQQCVGTRREAAQQAEKAADGLRSAISACAEAEAKAAELSAEQRAKALRESHRLRTLAVEKGHAAHRLFEQHLEQYCRDALLPGLQQEIRSMTVTEENVRRLSAVLQSRLRSFMKKELPEIGRQLQTTLTEPELPAAADTCGVNLQAHRYASCARYVLPAVAVLSFFTPISFLSWGTCILLPTFVLDKIGAANYIRTLIQNFGPHEGARRALLQAFRSELDSFCARAVAHIGEQIRRNIATAFPEPIFGNVPEIARERAL